MRKYRAVQTKYSNGKVNVKIQEHIFWRWWTTMNISKCTFFNRTSNILNKEQSICIEECDDSVSFELDNINHVKDILDWLSSNKRHYCFIDKDDKRIVYGIKHPDPERVYTYYASKDINEIKEFEKNFKNEVEPVHKTVVINWNVKKDSTGNPIINNNIVWVKKHN